MKKVLYIVLVTIIIGLGYLKYQARNDNMRVPPLEPTPSPSALLAPSPEPSLESSPTASLRPGPSATAGAVIIINPGGAQ